MAERELQPTQPSQEEGPPVDGVLRQEWATPLRALQIQMKIISQRSSGIETELERMLQEGQFEPDQLLFPIIQLHQYTGDVLLDVGAHVDQQNLPQPPQHASNIRRGAPAHQNPADAHTNLTVTTDNGSRAAPLRDQDLGATGGTEFVDIREGNEGPSDSTLSSQGGATTNMAPIASPSVRSPAPGDILVASEHDIQDATAPPTAYPTPEVILVTPDGQDSTEPPAVCPTSAPEDSPVAPGKQVTTEPPAAGPTSATDDILVPPDRRTVTEAPAPKANPPSKPLSSSPEPRQPPSSSQTPPPQPAAYPLLAHDYIPRRREAVPQARGKQHQQPPLSWPPTNSARAPSSADQLHFMRMPPGTVIPDSGPKAFIHLEGEHYPRLQAEEPD